MPEDIGMFDRSKGTAEKVTSLSACIIKDTATGASVKVLATCSTLPENLIGTPGTKSAFRDPYRRKVQL